MAIIERPAAHEQTTVAAPVLSRLIARDRRRAAAGGPRPAPGRYLAIEDGGETVLIPLRSKATRVGRDTAADVVLDDRSVSRRHALLIRREGGTVLLDDRSLNGIQVNGRRVMAAVLRDGDEIAVGAVQMRYLEITT
jgi:pSer/pThr/pTyr-binding forkhead associated (FHA) protein